MIGRVALDTDALLDHRDQGRGAMNTHRELVDVLTSFGYLELLGPDDASALFDAIYQLDSEKHALWSKAILALHSLNRVRTGDLNGTTRDASAIEPLPEPLRSTIDLLVVSNRVAQGRQPLMEDGFESRPGEPERTLADSIRHCRTIERLRTMHEHGNFAQGASRQTVWDELFVPPARLSTEATLLDRYFLEHLFNDRKREPRDHAEWLISSMDRDLASGSTVRLLCGWPSDRDRNAPIDKVTLTSRLRDHLGPILGSGRLDGVTVVLARWPTRKGDGPHNRHLRFSCGFAITSQEGFDRLDSSRIVGIDGFSWGAITSTQLLADLQAREDIILKCRPRTEIRL
jgi:hypothetical protein